MQEQEQDSVASVIFILVGARKQKARRVFPEYIKREEGTTNKTFLPDLKSRKIKHQ